METAATAIFAVAAAACWSYAARVGLIADTLASSLARAAV
jgi:hypothetical protein